MESSKQSGLALGGIAGSDGFGASRLSRSPSGICILTKARSPRRHDDELETSKEEKRRGRMWPSGPQYAPMPAFAKTVLLSDGVESDGAEGQAEDEVEG